jgi:hypothetical protein
MANPPVRSLSRFSVSKATPPINLGDVGAQAIQMGAMTVDQEEALVKLLVQRGVPEEQARSLDSKTLRGLMDELQQVMGRNASPNAPGPMSGLGVGRNPDFNPEDLIEGEDGRVRIKESGFPSMPFVTKPDPDIRQYPTGKTALQEFLDAALMRTSRWEDSGQPTSFNISKGQRRYSESATSPDRPTTALFRNALYDQTLGVRQELVQWWNNTPNEDPVKREIIQRLVDENPVPTSRDRLGDVQATPMNMEVQEILGALQGRWTGTRMNTIADVHGGETDGAGINRDFTAAVYDSKEDGGGFNTAGYEPDTDAIDDKLDAHAAGDVSSAEEISYQKVMDEMMRADGLVVNPDPSQVPLGLDDTRAWDQRAPGNIVPKSEYQAPMVGVDESKFKRPRMTDRRWRDPERQNVVVPKTIRRDINPEMIAQFRRQSLEQAVIQSKPELTGMDLSNISEEALRRLVPDYQDPRAPSGGTYQMPQVMSHTMMGTIGDTGQPRTIRDFVPRSMNRYLTDAELAQKALDSSVSMDTVRRFKYGFGGSDVNADTPVKVDEAGNIIEGEDLSGVEGTRGFRTDGRKTMIEKLDESPKANQDGGLAMVTERDKHLIYKDPGTGQWVKLPQELHGGEIGSHLPSGLSVMPPQGVSDAPTMREFLIEQAKEMGVKPIAVEDPDAPGGWRLFNHATDMPSPDTWIAKLRKKTDEAGVETDEIVPWNANQHRLTDAFLPREGVTAGGILGRGPGTDGLKESDKFENLAEWRDRQPFYDLENPVVDVNFHYYSPDTGDSKGLSEKLMQQGNFSQQNSGFDADPASTNRINSDFITQGERFNSIINTIISDPWATGSVETLWSMIGGRYNPLDLNDAKTASTFGRMEDNPSWTPEQNSQAKIDDRLNQIVQLVQKRAPHIFQGDNATSKMDAVRHAFENTFQAGVANPERRAGVWVDRAGEDPESLDLRQNPRMIGREHPSQRMQNSDEPRAGASEEEKASWTPPSGAGSKNAINSWRPEWNSMWAQLPEWVREKIAANPRTMEILNKAEPGLADIYSMPGYPSVTDSSRKLQGLPNQQGMPYGQGVIDRIRKYMEDGKRPLPSDWGKDPTAGSSVTTQGELPAQQSATQFGPGGKPFDHIHSSQWGALQDSDAMEDVLGPTKEGYSKLRRGEPADRMDANNNTLNNLYMADPDPANKLSPDEKKALEAIIDFKNRPAREVHDALDVFDSLKQEAASDPSLKDAFDHFNSQIKGVSKAAKKHAATWINDPTGQGQAPNPAAQANGGTATPEDKAAKLRDLQLRQLEQMANRIQKDVANGKQGRVALDDVLRQIEALKNGSTAAPAPPSPAPSDPAGTSKLDNAAAPTVSGPAYTEDPSWPHAPGQDFKWTRVANKKRPSETRTIAEWMESDPKYIRQILKNREWRRAYFNAHQDSLGDLFGQIDEAYQKHFTDSIAAAEAKGPQPGSQAPAPDQTGTPSPSPQPNQQPAPKLIPRDAFAAVTGIPVDKLDAMEAAGQIVPQVVNGEKFYTPDALKQVANQGGTPNPAPKPDPVDTPDPNAGKPDQNAGQPEPEGEKVGDEDANQAAADAERIRLENEAAAKKLADEAAAKKLADEEAERIRQEQEAAKGEEGEEGEEVDEEESEAEQAGTPQPPNPQPKKTWSSRAGDAASLVTGNKGRIAAVGAGGAGLIAASQLVRMAGAPPNPYAMPQGGGNSESIPPLFGAPTEGEDPSQIFTPDSGRGGYTKPFSQMTPAERIRYIRFDPDRMTPQTLQRPT